MSSNGDDSNEGLATVLTGVGLVAVLGPGIAASTVPKLQALLVRWGLLVDDGILIPIGDGAGLDLARLAVVAGIVGLLLVLLVVSARRAAERRRNGERR